MKTDLLYFETPLRTLTYGILENADTSFFASSEGYEVDLSKNYTNYTSADINNVNFNKVIPTIQQIFINENKDIEVSNYLASFAKMPDLTSACFAGQFNHAELNLSFYLKNHTSALKHLFFISYSDFPIQILEKIKFNEIKQLVLFLPTDQINNLNSDYFSTFEYNFKLLNPNCIVEIIDNNIINSVHYFEKIVLKKTIDNDIVNFIQASVSISLNPLKIFYAISDHLISCKSKTDQDTALVQWWQSLSFKEKIIVKDVYKDLIFQPENNYHSQNRGEPITQLLIHSLSNAELEKLQYLFSKSEKVLNLSFGQLSSIENIFSKNSPFLTTEEIYLEKNEMTNISPILSLQNLKKINLSSNNLNSGSLRKMSAIFNNLPQLSELNISKNRITDIGCLSHLKLNRLILSDNPITNICHFESQTITSFVANNTLIEDLNPIKDQPLDYLELLNCPIKKLPEFNTYANGFEDEGITISITPEADFHFISKKVTKKYLLKYKIKNNCEIFIT